jgi:hypothetical protein
VSLALPGANLALAISTDRTMMLYDLRIPTSVIPAVVPTSFVHPAMPSCIALPTYPGSTSTSDVTNQVVTGAYDGIVRVWDLRGTKVLSHLLMPLGQVGIRAVRRSWVWIGMRKGGCWELEVKLNLWYGASKRIHGVNKNRPANNAICQ